MAILISGEYRIHSKANSGNVLTVGGELKDAVPVRCQKATGEPKQVWRLNASRLYTELDPDNRNTFCLDRLDTSASPADIYTNNDDDNQLISLISIANEDYTYRIRLKNKTLYLTAADDGSCSWKAKDASNEKQLWVFERVIRVKDMPKIQAFAANKYVEYFSGCTSWKNGSFDPLEQGRDVADLVQKLYNRVCGGSPKYTVSENQDKFLYNFPGALAYGQTSDLNGYYHMGIDINYDKDAPVYPLKAGTVVDSWTEKSERRYSAVGIKSSFQLPDEDTPQDFVIWYLHMDNIKPKKEEYVTLDTQLGTISNKGATAAHLHIEAQKSDSLEPMVPSSAKVYLKENYFGAYDLLDLIEAA